MKNQLAESSLGKITRPVAAIKSDLFCWLQGYNDFYGDLYLSSSERYLPLFLRAIFVFEWRVLSHAYGMLFRDLFDAGILPYLPV